MEKIRIEQVEPRFAHELETPLKNTLKKLGYSIPESFRLRVSLCRPTVARNAVTLALTLGLPNPSVWSSGWSRPRRRTRNLTWKFRNRQTHCLRRIPRGQMPPNCYWYRGPAASLRGGVNPSLGSCRVYAGLEFRFTEEVS